MKTTRRLVQSAFLILTLAGVFLLKGNAERWCPFGGVEALYGYLNEGNLICSLGVSNFYILAAVLVMTLLFRRAFCGYLCPIGTVSEFVQAGARRLGVRPWSVPYRLDRALALLKYVVLAVILYFTWRVGELVFRGYDPCYALISRHGKDITVWAYVLGGAILLGSLFVLVPFCRWLCPLAAVFTPFSRFGLTRVRRGEHACVDCGLCSRACPMGIPVDRLATVSAARCTSCLDCVAACPRREEAALVWGPPPGLGRPWRQGVLLTGVMLCVAGAVAATYAFPLPSFVWERGVPPERVETVSLEIRGVKCRGTASGLVGFLERDDEYAVAGYLKVEAWPQPGAAPVRITFDPSQTDSSSLCAAVTEPLFDLDTAEWRLSPYEIVGYDPLEQGP